MSDRANLDLAKQVAEIEAILEWFESEDIDLSEALKKYEQGMANISQLEKYLASAKVRVSKINKKFDK
jgi:exodeoxyribonuclease VII small subunit